MHLVNHGTTPAACIIAQSTHAAWLWPAWLCWTKRCSLGSWNQTYARDIHNGYWLWPLAKHTGNSMVASPVAGILLVVLRLVVEELLQDLAEGLGLFLRKVHFEVVRGTELLVELLGAGWDDSEGRTRRFHSIWHGILASRLTLSREKRNKYDQIPCNSLPRLVLCLFQKESLILLAQGVLPCVEVIFEATHRHLAASRGDGVHHEATLRWHQGALHAGAKRQEHHRKEAHSAGHGQSFWLSRVFFRDGKASWG